MSLEDATGGVPVLDWFDGPIKQSISSVFSGLNAGVESLDIFSKFYNAHIACLRSDVEHLKLLGMSAPVSLIDIYNPARVSTTIRRRLYSEEWVDTSGASVTKKGTISPAKAASKLVYGDEYIEQHDRVAILGGPGAGKTTFLRFLALAYAEKVVFKKTKLKLTKIPFFVSLPMFQEQNSSIFDFLLSPIRKKTNEYAESFLRRVLNKGQAIILLDSLDEVSKVDRGAILKKINEFCSEFSKAKIVISCRTADYTDVGLDTFHEVEIAKLDKASVHKIITAWFSDEPEKATKLCSVIDTDRSISSLTETPLLLSLLCIQFRHDLSLPKRKIELFKRCSETLLRDWDTTRGFRRESSYEALTDQAKEKLFEVVAAHFTLVDFTFSFPKAKVLELISDFCSRVALTPEDAPQILEEVDQHHGILEKFSQDHYGFSHTSFHEYFAARAIVAKGLGLKVVQKYLDENDWYPVIEFVVAMADDPSDMIEHLIAKSDMRGLTNYPPMAKRTNWLHLLYRCLATSPYISIGVKNNAIRHLILSQVEIARIYGDGGVFPMSQLMEDGIRHPLFYRNKRSSLSAALQPFRMLTNEILKNPIPGYADAVFEILPTISSLLPNNYMILQDALYLNLITPLARIDGVKVHSLLTEMKKTKSHSAVNELISTSLKNIKM